jgi:hypothetical protein
MTPVPVLRGQVTDYLSAALIGISESIMYPITILIGKPEFIGFWIAAKAAGNWIQWTGERPTAREKDGNKEETNEEIKHMGTVYEGFRRFSRFLIGSAFSILWAYLTYT